MTMRGRVVKEMHSWMDDKLDQEIYRRVIQGRSDVTSGKKAGLGAQDVTQAVKQAIATKD